jgi:hypothetical protein
MKYFIRGEERLQTTLLPRCLEGYAAEDSAVRVIEAFIDELDLGDPGFEGVAPGAAGGSCPSPRNRRPLTTNLTARDVFGRP